MRQVCFSVCIATVLLPMIIKRLGEGSVIDPLTNKLLQVLASTVILDSESHGSHDRILLTTALRGVSSVSVSL
jgi:hypothetical protein